MQIELSPIERVKPYDRNPRVNDSAVDSVAASIKEFGFRQPIVVDRDGVIVVGHTRWEAAQKLKLEQVPVHVATDLTPEQARAYRIVDNATNELAQWDKELLPLELTDLQSVGFDLGLLGFSEDDLAKYLQPVTEGQCDPDDVPVPPDKPTTSVGDLWLLGDHRLLCSDSSKPENVDRLLDSTPIHLVNTDPPYNVKVEPRSNNAIAAGLSSFTSTHHQGLDLARHPGKSKPTQKKLRAKARLLANDFVTDQQFDVLLDAWFGNMARVLTPGRGFYIWGGYAHSIDPFVASFRPGRSSVPLSRHTLRKRYRTACKVLGAERLESLTIHHGRHTFISHALAGGRTLAEVKAEAGHASLLTTSVYLHVLVDEREEVGALFAVEV